MQKSASMRSTPRQKTMGTPSEGTKATMSLSELILIGVGGIIGAGFFLGCGSPIRSAGPSVILAFIFGGIITAQVIGALNTVAADTPKEGAFKAYADMYLGRYMGYMQGWTYYLTSILTISSEAVASAIFVRVWLPGVPVWVFSSVFAAIIILINAFGVKNFGVVESFMSIVKIAALVGFIVFIGLMLFGIFHGVSAPAGNTASVAGGAGFFANGAGGLLRSMLIVIFAFAGIGVFATAAIELKHPKELDTGGVVTVGVLTLLYVLSIGGVLLIFPWNRVSTNISPFVQALQHARMPILADILNAVILIASFSVMAGAVFSANRILQSLGHGGEAPSLVTKESKKRKIQYGALMMTTIGIAILIALSYVLPSGVYKFLVSASSFFTFFNWFLMLLTFLSWRRKNKGEGKHVSKLAFGQPVSTIVIMAAIVLLGAYALTEKSQRYGFYACVAIAIVLTVAYFFTRKHKGAHRHAAKE